MAPIKFLCWCLLWFVKRRDLVAFLRVKHTHRNGGVRDVHVLICTRVVQIGVAVNATRFVLSSTQLLLYSVVLLLHIVGG